MYDPLMDNKERIERNLTNHPPVNTSVVQCMEQVRASAKAFGFLIDDLCPDTRERSLAQTNLEQTVMWSIAAIARYQPEETS